LGAGTGVSGMAAAALGAKLVYLTDLKYTLPNIVSNINDNFPDYDARGNEEANELQKVSINPEDNSSRFIQVGLLDWSNQDTYKLPNELLLQSSSSSSSNNSSSSSSSSSINHDSETLTNSKLYETYQHWDVILGADIVWLEELVYSLVNTLNHLSSHMTTIIFAHQVIKLKHTYMHIIHILNYYFFFFYLFTHNANGLSSSDGC